MQQFSAIWLLTTSFWRENNGNFYWFKIGQNSLFSMIFWWTGWSRMRSFHQRRQSSIGDSSIVSCARFQVDLLVQMPHFNVASLFFASVIGELWEVFRGKAQKVDQFMITSFVHKGFHQSLNEPGTSFVISLRDISRNGWVSNDHVFYSRTGYCKFTLHGGKRIAIVIGVDPDPSLSSLWFLKKRQIF